MTLNVRISYFWIPNCLPNTLYMYMYVPFTLNCVNVLCKCRIGCTLLCTMSLVLRRLKWTYLPLTLHKNPKTDKIIKKNTTRGIFKAYLWSEEGRNDKWPLYGEPFVIMGVINWLFQPGIMGEVFLLFMVILQCLWGVYTFFSFVVHHSNKDIKTNKFIGLYLLTT